MNSEGSKITTFRESKFLPHFIERNHDFCLTFEGFSMLVMCVSCEKQGWQSNGDNASRRRLPKSEESVSISQLFL
jgi:hypothetical protein